VSASVSSDIVRYAAMAVGAASALILIYMTFSFWSMDRPSATASARSRRCCTTSCSWSARLDLRPAVRLRDRHAIHHRCADSGGFSVHDTIVVFDRVRENAKRAEAAGADVTLAQTVNASLNQTLGRSLNTSITVILTLVTLILLGGDTVRDFLVIMLVGMVSGTYSSIFIASQLLVSWDEGDFGSLVPSRRRPEEAPA
jgi:preprotein translocase subunit SecF